MDEAPLTEVLQPDSLFSYQCHHCYQCCQTRTIALNPYDIACLAAHESISTGRFIDQYMLLSEQGACLRHASEGDCAFLSNNGCLAYEHRPLACRSYPLLRQTDLDGEVSLVVLEQQADSAGITGKQGNVDSYLRHNQYENGANAADQYAEMYIKLFKRVEKGDASSVNTETLLADAVLFQTIFLDMDLMIRCHRADTDLSLTPEEKIQLHFKAIKAWLEGDLKTHVLLDALGRFRDSLCKPDHPMCTGLHSDIEGCEWPYAGSRLNSWATALDYQFRQGQATRHEQESLLLRQLESLLKQHARFSPFYTALCAGDDLSNMTYQRYQSFPVLDKEILSEAGTSSFSTQLPSSHGAVLEQAVATADFDNMEIRATELSLAFQKAIYTGLKTGEQQLQKSRSSLILPAAILNTFDTALHWASSPGSGAVSTLDSSALSSVEILNSLLLERPTDIICTAVIWRALKTLMDESAIQPFWLEHVFIVQSKRIGIDPGLCYTPFTALLTEIFVLREVGIIAARNKPDAPYKVPRGHLLVEILNQHNDSCKEGEPGRIVVTDLHNFATPLIRYETGVTGIPGQASGMSENPMGCHEFLLTTSPENA